MCSGCLPRPGVWYSARRAPLIQAVNKFFDHVLANRRLSSWPRIRTVARVERGRDTGSSISAESGPSQFRCRENNKRQRTKRDMERERDICRYKDMECEESATRETEAKRERGRDRDRKESAPSAVAPQFRPLALLFVLFIQSPPPARCLLHFSLPQPPSRALSLCQAEDMEKRTFGGMILTTP